ncbi:MAG TPA: 50S ribosomal protein L11 methyltransferase [Acidimicrobiales bacterium]|nr:50S ribosomal protein L11 methyltransferase [Acidimicrobiales bacterium]
MRVAVAAHETELAADALWQAGAAAIEEQPGALVAATTDGGDPARLLAAVAGRWPAEAIAVDLEGALDAWREHARPVVVGDRLIVRPPWVEREEASRSRDAPPDGALDVVVDPGRAFGHGAHPTTRLVLDALVEAVRGGERVLDVGCGSGVLAIAALALGARTAVGVDVDPAALAATRANAARNGMADRVIVVAAVDDPAVAGRYDLVVANMLASQLVAVAPTVAGAVAPGGTVVLSGLLAAQRDQVLGAYGSDQPTRLAVVGEREDDGWLCLTLRAG